MKKKQWMMEVTYFAAEYLSHKEILFDDWARDRWFALLDEHYTPNEKPQDFVKRLRGTT